MSKIYYILNTVSLIVEKDDFGLFLSYQAILFTVNFLVLNIQEGK